MASSIPNLSTLRRGRGGQRQRGQRRPPLAPPEPSDTDAHDSSATQDRIVQGTDNDASNSRLSAIQLGYLQDDFAQAFAGNVETSRRFPIINRGTYVRTTAIDRLVARFFAANQGKKKQIISLGAGSDTRFFRMQHLTDKLLYHEVDFETNIAAKQAAIARSPLLSDTLRTAQTSDTQYLLHRIDLRSLDAERVQDFPGLEPDTPTLLLSECCLCYLLPEEASAALDFFTKKLSSSVGIVLYEPIRPDDAFGRTMVSNLASRGIQLQTIKRYASLEAQRERLTLAGFDTRQGALDVFQIWQGDDWISEGERERVEKLEWLDEIEEWRLLANHYCIAWAHRGEHFDAAWSDVNGEKGS